MKIVKYYPYRKGLVRGHAIPRELARPLEEELCKLAGVSIDNHVCFFLLDEYSNPFAVMFHDLVCVFGQEVDERGMG
jgi:hypothetical protein